VNYDRRYVAGAAVLVVAVAAFGFAGLNDSKTDEGPGTTYGFQLISQDSGLFDLPALMVAGPSLGNDNPDKYTCWGDSFYIDEDGDRTTEYFTGENSDLDPGEYYVGYEKSKMNAEACGGFYNYRCDLNSGCEGFVEDDEEDETSDDDDSSDDSEQEDTNEAPEIDSIDTPSTVNVSETFTVSVEASDPDDPSLSYSWSNGKTGDSIILNYGEPGIKELDVEVSDGEKTASSTVRVNVVEPEDEQETSDTDTADPGPIESFWNWFTALFS
jgi:hypothetical protein